MGFKAGLAFGQEDALRTGVKVPAGLVRELVDAQGRVSACVQLPTWARICG